jgi:hypothetical protein
MKLENNYHIPNLVQAFPKKMVGPFECTLENGTVVITFIRQCANRSGAMSYRCSFLDIQGSKRPPRKMVGSDSR